MSTRKPKGTEAWERLEYERKKRQSMEGIAAAASAGDREAARVMLRYAEHHIGESGDIPAPLVAYLVDCFSRAIHDDSTEFAFNLKRKAARGSSADEHSREFRDSQLARAVAYHHEQGMSIAAACRHVANNEQPTERKLGRVSASAVKQAYLRFFPEQDN